jgi:hypothetical protein
VASEGRFLALSVGLHAALLCGFGAVALARALATDAERVTPPPVPAFDVEIDETPEPMKLPVVAPEPLPPPPEPTDDAPPPEAVARVAPRAVSPNANTGPSEPSPASTGDARRPPADEYDTLPDDRGRVLTVPGLNGPPVWAMPGVLPPAQGPAPAPTVAPRARQVDSDIAGKVVREAMHDRDKSKGFELPAAGNAASAVQASLYGSDLPADSRGTIAVRIGPNGQVLDARVVTMVGGDVSQWERAAAAAVARLRAMKLELPEAYKNGATIYVDAVSVAQLPAGGGSGFNGPGSDSGAGAKFDISNIGAHKRQVVRTTTRIVAR